MRYTTNEKTMDVHMCLGAWLHAEQTLLNTTLTWQDDFHQVSLHNFSRAPHQLQNVLRVWIMTEKKNLFIHPIEATFWELWWKKNYVCQVFLLSKDSIEWVVCSLWWLAYMKCLSTDARHIMHLKALPTHSNCRHHFSYLKLFIQL